MCVYIRVFVYICISTVREYYARCASGCEIQSGGGLLYRISRETHPGPTNRTFLESVLQLLSFFSLLLSLFHFSWSARRITCMSMHACVKLLLFQDNYFTMIKFILPRLRPEQVTSTCIFSLFIRKFESSKLHS